MLQENTLGVLTVDRLNVKRIDVREENGAYAMVIANSQNLPGPDPDDAQDKSRRGIPGILFYDPLGEEIGGLIFPARQKDGSLAGGVQLSMDQLRQQGGQAIALCNKAIWLTHSPDDRGCAQARQARFLRR